MTCRLGLPLGEAVQRHSFKPCAAASHALKAWYGIQLVLTHITLVTRAHHTPLLPVSPVPLQPLASPSPSPSQETGGPLP